MFKLLTFSRWEQKDSQLGDSCAEIDDAIHAQAGAQINMQSPPRPSSTRFRGRESRPPPCENPTNSLERPRPPLPLQIPVIIAPPAAGNADHGGSVGASGGNDALFHQLKGYVKETRSAIDAVDFRQLSVDSLFAKYESVRSQGSSLCKALMDGGIRRRVSRQAHSRTVSASSTALSTALSPAIMGDGSSSAVDLDSRRTSLEGSSPGVVGLGVLTRRATAPVDISAEKSKQAKPEPKPAVPGPWLQAVKDWRSCIEQIAAAHKKALTDTYKRYEHFATPEILEALFADRKSRQQIVSLWVKNFGAYKRMQGQTDVATTWEAQFQNYDLLVQDTADVTELLTAEGSGASLERDAQDYTITPRGDAILEFTNPSMGWKPMLRFRVSSHMLAETSPIFARMFARPGDVLDDPEWSEEDLAAHLPPPPVPFTCADGSRVSLYRMPQLELNKEGALTLLLYAAHMRNDMVPREIPFDRFVAVAEVAMRYRCTSPLEIFVEHRWLPQWMHMAQVDMPDGMVVISCAFGLRGLFTRVTKTIIMNMVDETDLLDKTWPDVVKEKIWNVRCAKMAQVYAACTAAVEEYLQPPPEADLVGDGRGGLTRTDHNPSPLSSSPVGPALRVASLAPSTITAFPPVPVFGLQSFTSQPRCPKGSHWCDATNLGWLMMIFNQLQLLPVVLQSPTIPRNGIPPPRRSLAQVVDALRIMASPPNPVHPGRSVCDPAPAFRSAINDIYNSVSGLTLYDIDGRLHGWALSRGRRFEPQDVLHAGPAMDWENRNTHALLTPPETEVISEEEEQLDSSATRAFNEEAICLGVMECLDSFDDLHSAALVNWTMHETYKTSELVLMRNLVQMSRRRTMSILLGDNELREEDTKEKPRCSPGLDGGFKMVDKSAADHAVDEQEKERAQQAAPESNEATPEPSLDGLSSIDDDETAVQSDGDFVLEPFPPLEEVFIPSSANMCLATGKRTSASAPERPAHNLSEGTSYLSMTMEEANQILWPSPPLSPQETVPSSTQEDTKASGSLTVSRGELEGDSVKFRLEAAAEAEDKMLIQPGDKQLREDFDRRVGLLS